MLISKAPLPTYGLLICLELFGSESVWELLTCRGFWNANEQAPSHHRINRIKLYLYYHLSHLVIVESNKKEDTMK